MSTASVGKAAEDLACRVLQERGYEILARRYRTRAGEIDIVAREDAVLVFVEVKMRTSADYGAPGEAVAWRKQHRLTMMALDYLARQKVGDVPCRFDVVAVSPSGSGRSDVEIIRNAFDATR